MYGESVKLSTVSTYLAQLHAEGFLERKGSKALRKYRLAIPRGERERGELQQEQKAAENCENE